MEYILIGKIVSTHGIKGEIKIISNFEYKDRVFIKDNYLYIGNKKEEKKINTYRKHKTYDMVTFSEYNNINQVLPFLKENVYIKKESLNLNNNDFLDIDLIGLSVIINGKIIGTVKSIRYASKTNKLIDIATNNKSVSIPYHKDFIKSVNLEDKTIEFNLIEGLI